MSIPIEVVDTDYLIRQAGVFAGIAENLSQDERIYQTRDTSIYNAKLVSDLMLRCAGYIRFLEGLAFRKDDE